MLTTESAKTLMHAFVSNHLDYCSSLLYSVSDELLQKLQVVQNAAAHVVTGARRFDQHHSSSAQTPLVARLPTDQV